MNRQVLLGRRPSGMPSAADFQIIESPVPSVGEGEVLRRTIYLSLDPYMRGRMSVAPSYARGVNSGEVMPGGTVSQVIESRDPSITPGDFVLGSDGWQLYGVSRGQELRKLDPATTTADGGFDLAPPIAALRMPIESNGRDRGPASRGMGRQGPGPRLGS